MKKRAKNTRKNLSFDPKDYEFIRKVSGKYRTKKMAPYIMDAVREKASRKS